MPSTTSCIPMRRSVVPRSAVVGWYETDFAPQGMGPIEVTGVRFVEWTWPVTGKTYGNTAEVSYRQQRADGVLGRGCRPARA